MKENDFFMHPGGAGVSFRDYIAMEILKILLKEGIADTSFPAPYKSVDMDDYDDDDDDRRVTPIDKADYTSIINRVRNGDKGIECEDYNNEVRVFDFDYLATLAYDCADAMLRARKKGE